MVLVSQVFYLNNVCVYKTIQENVRPSIFLLFNSLILIVALNLRQKILTVLRNETSSCSDPPSASAIIGQVAYDEVSYKDNPILMLRVVDWPPVILVVCQSKVILLLYYLFISLFFTIYYIHFYVI